MNPVISNRIPVSDDQLNEVARRLAVVIPPRLRAVIKEVNGGRPEPRDVPCQVYSGETDVPVYEFARWDDPKAYLELCRVYREDLCVPDRFLVFAVADADAIFVDIEDPDFRVMYFQYVEGDYVTHFGDGEMDLVHPTVEGFMSSFFDAPRALYDRCPNPECRSLRGWDGLVCRFCGTRQDQTNFGGPK